MSRKTEIKKMNSAMVRLASDNPWLAGMVMTIKNAPNDGKYMFGPSEATAFVRAAYAIPKVLSSKSEEELMDGADIFWDIIDFAKNEPMEKDDGWHRGVMAAIVIFRSFVKKGIVTEEFKHDIHSPYRWLTRHSFRFFIENRYTKREDFWSLDYKRVTKYTTQYGYHPLVVFLPFESAFLRDSITKAFVKWNYGMSEYKAVAILEHAEEWFKDAGTINSLDDVTVARLDCAVRYILAHFNDKEARMRRLRFLFYIWKEFLRMDTEKDFFHNSPLWTAECLMDMMTAKYLADGYHMIRAGNTNRKLKAYDKVLFCVCWNNYHTASGVYYRQIGVDFSGIVHIGWRTALINYADSCISNGKNDFSHAVKFIKWITKRGTQYYKKTIYITRQAMTGYRAYLVSECQIKDTSKHTLFQSAKHFICWGEASGYFLVEERALNPRSMLHHTFHKEDKAIPLKTIKGIIQLLEQMYELTGKLRYLYASIVLCLQCHSSSRAGEIICIEVSHIIFHDNGTCSVLTRGKNNGSSLVERHYNEIATDYIRKALGASRDVRCNCPKCSYKDCLFLYCDEDNKETRNKCYHQFNINCYNHTIGEACSRMKIENCTSGNVRHTFITKIKSYAREKGLPDQAILAMTGHARMTTVNGYENIRMDEILEAASKISLGQPNKR